MQLSGEDLLKLNVLLHNDIEAVRIHEASMTLYALSADGGEAKIELNPNCKSDRYLKQVREMLSGHVLGSPGGYPVFLKRWTRMGQAKDDSLADLLLLGEPEAVVAVANAPGLTDELARRAWWADPISENARRMLANPNVVRGAMGKVLAEFLVEHLAFETEPLVQIDTVRLVLQPGLINDQAKTKLWDSGARKNALRVGFLQSVPDQLPESHPAHAEYENAKTSLESIGETGNRFATMLLKTLSAEGQGFLLAVEGILKKPANQDVVVALTNTIGSYFTPARTSDQFPRDINQLIRETSAACEQPSGEIAELLDAAPGLKTAVTAMMVMAQISEEIVTPIFSQTTAEGTLMRRKLEPVTTPLFEQLAVLRGS